MNIMCPNHRTQLISNTCYCYRDLTATITFKNDLLALREVHKVTLELYESIQGVPDMDFIFSYVPLPFTVVSQSLLRGGDVLGLDRNPKDRICKSAYVKILRFHLS